MGILESVFGKSDEEQSVAHEGQEVKMKWRQYIESCKDERPLWEAQVAVCENFASGNHRVAVTPQGQFKEYPRQPGEIWRTVNLWPITLSVITTRLTANDPRWNPKKAEMEEVSDAEIEAADAALQHIWNGSGDSERSVKREMKRAIRSSYKQGRRLLYMRFDDELGLPVLDSFPLWDVYSDPSSDDLRYKRWLCIVMPKHIDWLEDNYPDAEKMKLSPDNRLAESKMHEQFIKSRTGQTRDRRHTVNTIYGFRIVSKEYEEDEYADVDETDEETGDTVSVRKATGQKIKKTKNVILHEVLVENSGNDISPILHSEEIEYETLADIFDSFAPRDDEEFYARPPCIDWVDPSKTINKSYSTIEAYIDMFGQGKWIITRKGLQIPVGGLNGQKIYAQPGEIVQLPMQPLPQTHFTQLQNGISQYQQITGVHGATYGNIPSGDTSGKALAQASALDEQNSSDDVDNFKMCLERVAVKMLRLMADNWDSVRTIYRYDKQTGESKKFQVIGEKYAGNADALDSNDVDAVDSVMADVPEGAPEKQKPVRIRPFKRVDVEIVIGQFFKSVHKQELLVQILNAGWEPGMNPVKDRVILDTIDIGVGREMVRELKKLRNPQLMIAEGKAALLAEGEEVPVTRTDPHEFLKNFYAQKAKQALENGDQNMAQIFNRQAQKHAILMAKGMGSAGSPEVPTTNEEFLQGQGGLETQGNAAPSIAPGLVPQQEALGAEAPPIPGMR